MSISGLNENPKLSTLVDEMGFQREHAERALRECNDNIEAATDKLLQMAESKLGCQNGGHKTELTFPGTSWPDTPPPYSEVIKNPPPYAANYDLPPAQPSPFVNLDKLALFGDEKLQQASGPEMRCSKCFDPIHPYPSEEFSGQMVCEGVKVEITVFSVS